ncbi:hypothetical protein [Levilactobacillus yiduensis]|uniref:hypothetical protein n=1 Tax=Levilactobacillus yiduensis TaxID=2953880 RepID=UPI001AD7EB19|nr:hypothetical protein [Levilactobacillus yiduensis]
MNRKACMVGVALLGALAGGTVTANASTQYLGVTTHKFLQTKRKIVTKNTAKTATITIPKGTVVQIQAISASNGKTAVGLNINQLSYHIRKTDHQKGLMTRSIAATTKNFKHVSVPKYLAFYATQKTYPDGALRNYKGDGNLFKGTKYPKNDTKAKLARVHITPDGYLEYYKRSAFINKKVDGKPTTSVKITKAVRPGKSGKTTLYTKSAVPKAIGTKVKTSGKYRYKITIKRLKQYYATTFYQSKTKNVLNSIEIAAGYQVGKQQYFMSESTVYPA